MAEGLERPIGLRRPGPAGPWWLRALAMVDRVYGGFAIARDEFALSRLREGQWSSLVVERYEAAEGFYSGANNARGFVEDEQALVARWLPPPPGRVLVPAAGAGREVLALAAAGYQVAAFDPAAPLLAEMRDSLRRRGIDGPVALASYWDFMNAVLGSAGPGSLTDILATAPFAAVLLGLNSFTHLRTLETRVRLLKACRAICPTGPVLATFYLERIPMSRVRGRARSLFALLPGAQPVSRGDQVGIYGYEHAFSQDELREVAALSDYELAHLGAGFLPCGVFLACASPR
ncbi:MAG: hypothetical protein JJE39_09955 [Vicinamibacteria bacterium]|nr:hypothetical protein [Vicinamibacteria bacterium]